MQIYTCLKPTLDQIGETALLLWQKGWAEMRAGNISVNVSEQLNSIQIKTDAPYIALPQAYRALGEKYFFITGAGTRMRDVAKNPLDTGALIQLSGSGGAYRIINIEGQEKPALPTSELQTHLALQFELAIRQPKLTCVLHTHPTNIIALTHHTEVRALSSVNRFLMGIHPETVLIAPKGFGYVPYEASGGADIAIKTSKQFELSTFCIWARHGVVAAGYSPLHAFDRIDVADKVSEIALKVLAMAQYPVLLSKSEIDDLLNLYNPDFY